MKLYALKCDRGYIKNSGSQGCEYVPIEKASVFNESNLAEAHALLERLKLDAVGVRIVELVITERDIVR